ASGRERHIGIGYAVIGVAAIAAPFALALIGPDYLIARNVLPAWLPLAVAVAAGLTVPGGSRAGPAAAALACAVGLVGVIATAADERYQRDDWRDAAKALGPVSRPRAIVVTPASGGIPLPYYVNGAMAVPP